MPTPQTPDHLLQEALDIAEIYGSGHMALKAGATTVKRTVFDTRVAQARLKGMKPTVKKDAPRVYTRQRIGKMHLVIPDTQVKPGVCTDHMEWIGNYIVEKKPDVIVHIGDHYDFPSLSSYDKGKISFEGRRYVNDVKAGRDAMERLLKPLQDYNRTAREKYQPEMHFCLGNHEIRVSRVVDNNPEYHGKFDLADLGLEDFGWTVHDFLKPVEIDGILYCHFFTSGVMGRPVSSAAALLRERQQSATMGHVQKWDLAVHPKTQNIGLFAGVCYLHDEDYLSPQGNECKRHVVVKNEVEDGRFDPMFASLRYLEKAYS